MEEDYSKIEWKKILKSQPRYRRWACTYKKPGKDLEECKEKALYRDCTFIGLKNHEDTGKGLCAKHFKELFPKKYKEVSRFLGLLTD